MSVLSSSQLHTVTASLHAQHASGMWHHSTPRHITPHDALHAPHLEYSALASPYTCALMRVPREACSKATSSLPRLSRSAARAGEALMVKYLQGRGEGGNE